MSYNLVGHYRVQRTAGNRFVVYKCTYIFNFGSRPRGRLYIYIWVCVCVIVYYNIYAVGIYATRYYNIVHNKISAL